MRKNRDGLSTHFKSFAEKIRKGERKDNHTTFPNDLSKKGAIGDEMGVYMVYCMDDQYSEWFRYDQQMKHRDMSIEYFKDVKKSLEKKGLIKITKVKGMPDHITLFDGEGNIWEG